MVLLGIGLIVAAAGAAVGDFFFAGIGAALAIFGALLDVTR